MVNGSIEFESQAQGSVFTDYCLLCWTQAQEVSHQLVGAEPDNNEDSGLAVEKLLSSINQTDTFTQSQSIYFIRFQVFATCQDWKITHQDSSINHTTAVMIVKGREETGFLKIVYHLPIKKWGDHTWGLVTTQSSLISWTQGDGGTRNKKFHGLRIIYTPSAHLTLGLALIRRCSDANIAREARTIVGISCGGCGNCSQ